MIKIKEEWINSEGKYECPYCGKAYTKKGIATHIWRNHGEGIGWNKNNENKIAWNKGLTKETSESIKIKSEKLKERYKNGELEPHFKNKKHTRETKERISLSRRRFLEENPDRVPYVINHSSKESWPEKLFKKALKENGISGWEEQHRNGIYKYDFAFPNIKLDVEVDGSQHKQEKVKRIDERRDEWSKENGWEVLRFPAKKVNSNVEECIRVLKDYLAKF